MHIRPPLWRDLPRQLRSFLSSFSLTLYALFPRLVSPRLWLIYCQLSFGPALLAVLNSSFRWRDHLRLIAFHPLLVRSFGGLARGACIVIVVHILLFISNGCHALSHLVLDAAVQPTQEHSFFELIKRPYQAVACGHPQMSSQLGRP